MTLIMTVLLGYAGESLYADTSSDEVSSDQRALGPLDVAALEVPLPGKSDVRAPVDGVCSSIQRQLPWCSMLTCSQVVNKRCNEWTMEYVQYLITLGYLHSSAFNWFRNSATPQLTASWFVAGPAANSLDHRPNLERTPGRRRETDSWSDMGCGCSAEATGTVFQEEGLESSGQESVVADLWGPC
ncbi:hypothetical protein N657DRAFT_78851 [Parathielavia appendiculata]|uniref:Uncharacterized protein n=1 Tax=Parathielavia appendiculata TaxID=2587402 RepID=A0AAN6UB69_9PEZI|nr:hypothetical protein N657DRAFT_78851 [Parathielavia appendiculata]